MTEVSVLGIRHHGPGSARAVQAALDDLRPDAVLIEGPPELDSVAALAASPHMEPPVAALVYAVDEPKTAGFYPMAVFSPEWVALQWAATAGKPVRFLDLPATNGLALRGEGVEGAEDGPLLHEDPLRALAEAAGYDDTERWWEDAIEHRYHGLDVFAVVLEAMTALREVEADRDEHNERREAAMRRVLRAMVKEGHERIAVVCGAWHAPALVPDRFPTQASDAALLKGLPTVKVAATWVPWTSSRLARASGYGAGVTAPGWYHHLFTSPDDAVLRWMVRVAGLLRDERLDVSSASVIEAVRLSEALATLRGRPLAGLAELMESTEAVLCGGSNVPVQLVARKLLVGDILGRVPDETPMVPLARDLARAQKRLRLKPSAAAQTVELDLRTESHLDRSKLLHRLRLLDVPWGQPAETGRTRGTFKEGWALEWFPELEVALIEASTHGTTIESAATAVVGERATAADIAELSLLVDASLLADLPDALNAVLAVLDERAARQHDTAVLMAAIEPLARARRYGNVRKVDTEILHRVLAGVVVRVAVGLAAACASLDDDAAAAMRAHVDSVQRGIALVDDPELRAAWTAALVTVSNQTGVHGLLGGRIVRLLFDGGRVDGEELGRRLGLTLSPAEDANRAAAWLEGFLSGDAVLLLHEPNLLQAIDGWVTAVRPDVFDDLLPLLRRTFARFQPAERRAIGEQIRRGHAGGPRQHDDEQLDHERAARVLPRILDLLRTRMSPDDRLRRWRLLLGSADDAPGGFTVEGLDAQRDATLDALYGETADRKGGLGRSSPRVARWLGDIRTYFPTSVVQVMQRDAMDRLGLRELLLEPELLESVQPDVHLVGTLLALNHAIPERSRETARAVVRQVVEQLERRLAQATRQAVRGALNRSARTRRPRLADIDWNRTILANLRHYQPEHRTVIPERLIGFGRHLPEASRDIVLCIDQSGSMASSVVYAGVFAAVLASIRSVRTRVVAFDTEVVDLTDELQDPVDVLFGIQLGGGTDINVALGYCETLIEQPRNTILVLISDLFDGGEWESTLAKARSFVEGGVQVVALLALSDDGAPAYSHENAGDLAELGIPAFACTPDLFPDLMAAAIQRRSLSEWAATNDLTTAAPTE